MAGANGNGKLSKPANPKKGAFLAALMEAGGHIGNACSASSSGRSTVRLWRETDPDFETAYHEAMEHGADILEDEARRRAITGISRMKFHQGQPIMVPCDANHPSAIEAISDEGVAHFRPYLELEYSDTLLIFLLKGIRPEKYRERISHKVDAKVTVTDGLDLLKDPEVANALDDALTRRCGRLPLAEPGSNGN